MANLVALVTILSLLISFSNFYGVSGIMLKEFLACLNVVWKPTLFARVELKLCKTAPLPFPILGGRLV